MIMWLRVGCRIVMTLKAQAPLIAMLRPRSGAQQWVAREQYLVEPEVPVDEYTDSYGNLCQRLVVAPGSFSIHTMAEVRVPDALDRAPGAPFIEVQTLPEAVLLYLMPSRYCESDRVRGHAVEITRGRLLGYDQVDAIARWVHANLRYAPDADPEPVSAETILARGNGVCRDYAHVGMALCRSLSIPARYVVGYLQDLEPMDIHAWFEAFVGGRWYTFDPMRPDSDGGRVTMAYGRDAADTVVFSQFGPPVVPESIDVFVQPMDGSASTRK